MRPEATAFLESASQVMPGKWPEVRLALVALLARGHALVEDVPGMGKTTLVHFIARAFGLDFKRVQFTNDLLPADILGVSVFRPEAREFHFRPGPVFAELLLADELNRAPPKTQSALLQAMEERHVSVEGVDHKLPAVFTVMATQNPRGMVGTFPLPESQLDRFLVKFPMGQLERKAELQLLAGPPRRELLESMPALASVAQLRAWQEACAETKTSEALLDYVLRLLEASRGRADVRPLSPRAGLDVVRAARALAWLEGRAHVLPEDVQDIFPYVTGHRLLGGEGGCAQEAAVARQLLESVRVA